MSKKKTIVIDVELAAELKVFAAKSRRTMTEIVEEAVRLFLDKKNGEEKDG